ncbi:hypothetical protein FJY70_01820 [candidate division WOR-3 bacterium]|nr:hypothetical protein [candidate division WOR-3 bacterium]
MQTCGPDQAARTGNLRMRNEQIPDAPCPANSERQRETRVTAPPGAELRARPEAGQDGRGVVIPVTQ